MVKNTFGGNKHKGFARKNMNPKSNKLRIAEFDGEIYAIATKMLGNNMLHCHCIDNLIRLCHIRGKFTGRGKRDNIINAGTWLLIGIREWDSGQSNQKMPQCDLLEVYKDLDVSRLKDSVTADWTVLTSNDVKNDISCAQQDNTFEFTTERDEERHKFIKEMNSDNVNKLTLKTENDEEEEINFDDL
jgi:initiation factor 1A